MISSKASTTCRSKSSVCLANKSVVFIKFLPDRVAQCRLLLARVSPIVLRSGVNGRSEWRSECWKIGIELGKLGHPIPFRLGSLCVAGHAPLRRPGRPGDGTRRPVMQLVSSTLMSGNNSLALVICSGCGSLSVAKALLRAAHPLPTFPSVEDLISRMIAEWVAKRGVNLEVCKEA